MEEIKYWLSNISTRQLIELLPKICKAADTELRTSPLYDLPRDIYEEHVKDNGTSDDILSTQLRKHIDAKTTPEQFRRLQAEKTAFAGRCYVVLDGFTIDGENVGVAIKEKAIQL